MRGVPRGDPEAQTGTGRRDGIRPSRLEARFTFLHHQVSSSFVSTRVSRGPLAAPRRTAC
eukprot:scaffold85740_cov66-Phaeocystis_antarctica.AAC.19